MYLEVIFKFSKSDSNLDKTIGVVFNDFKTKLSDKNSILNITYKLNEDLSVFIETENNLRAHDLLLQLRKLLNQELGKQLHIGIRNIEIKKFDIEIESNKKINDKIPYVSDVDYKNNTLKLILDVGSKNGINMAEIENRYPDRIINLVNEKLEDYGGKTEHWELLWESKSKDLIFNKDPTNELEKKHWIKHGYNRGQWIYGPEITHLFKTFEKIVKNEVIDKLDFNEMIFPKLVPWEVWMKSGHAQGVYPEIYHVCPPKTRDPEYWQEVSDIYKITRKVPVDLINEKIDAPIGGLCYAQCPSFWPFIEGCTLEKEQLPIKVFDKSGTSHRYESGGIHGIERVDEFHRIELVWLGTKNQVLNLAERLKERYSYIFENILELEWRMAWVTPWFMVQEGKYGLSDMDGAGTVDYEAITPYNDSWIEIQNLSVNAEKYTKGFNVKSQTNEKLWSGCNGVGLERWAAAFIGQYGLNQENWPEKFRKYFGDLPKGIKIL